MGKFENEIKRLLKNVFSSNLKKDIINYFDYKDKIKTFEDRIIKELKDIFGKFDGKCKVEELHNQMIKIKIIAGNNIQLSKLNNNLQKEGLKIVSIIPDNNYNIDMFISW